MNYIEFNAEEGALFIGLLTGVIFAVIFIAVTYTASDAYLIDNSCQVTQEVVRTEEVNVTSTLHYTTQSSACGRLETQCSNLNLCQVVQTEYKDSGRNIQKLRVRFTEKAVPQ